MLIKIQNVLKLHEVKLMFSFEDSDILKVFFDEILFLISENKDFVKIAEIFVEIS